MGRRRLHMYRTAHPENAVDLLVDGTFALRRSLDRLARAYPAQGASGRLVAEQLRRHPPLAQQVARRDQSDDLALADRR
jgi:hypothetical protein